VAAAVVGASFWAGLWCLCDGMTLGSVFETAPASVAIGAGAAAAADGEAGVVAGLVEAAANDWVHATAIRAKASANFFMLVPHGIGLGSGNLCHSAGVLIVNALMSDVVD
jgi:hypothetical protein